MTASLRTRLFLTIGAVLGASIAATGLLSRRATLVEVREVVARPAAPERTEDAAAQVRARIGRDGAEALAEALADAQRAWGRPFIVIDASRSIVASSAPRFGTATVRELSPDTGQLVIEVRDSAGTASIFMLKGGALYPLEDRGGRTIGTLVPLPVGAGDEDAGPATTAPPFVPAWIVATAGVAMIGLILTFALSRRILRPIGELTDAVRRMDAGDLDVRVVAAAASRDEIGHLGRSFNALAARLAELDRLRRQMVGDVAHELRSPVTNLRCILESIQDGLAPADAAAIAALHDEAMYLQHLIADLQDLTLAEAGKLSLAVSSVEVAAATRQAMAAAGAVPGARIAVDLPDALPPVAADPARLEQILRNLLMNARRHTPESGTITVRGRAEGGLVRIEVADTGAGIEAAHLPHVFERFYRADGSRSRATGGAGLGLAIVRHLVRAQDGTVGVASEGAGRGATFVVHLPAAGTAAGNAGDRVPD